MSAVQVQRGRQLRSGGYTLLTGPRWVSKCSGCVTFGTGQAFPGALILFVVLNLLLLLFLLPVPFRCCSYVDSIYLDVVCGVW